MADARRAAILREGERVLGGFGNLPSTLTLGQTTYIPERERAAAQRAAAQEYIDARRSAAADNTALRGGAYLEEPTSGSVKVTDARYGAMSLGDMARVGREIVAANNIAEDPEDYSSAADPRTGPSAALPISEYPTYGLETPERREEQAASLSSIERDIYRDDERTGEKRKSRKNKTKKEKGKNKKSSNKRKSSKSRKRSRKNKH